MDSATAIPWSQKKEVVLFRGNLNTWDSSRIAALISGLQHPELIDAKLVSMDSHSCERIKQSEHRSEFSVSENCEEVVGKHLSPSDFGMFKYWLDIDGHGATFRFKNYLHGDSVVFKVESEYYQYFHADLRPWVHYIPISKKNTVRDIAEKVLWAREHDTECFKMVQRTKAWAKSFLSHEQAAWYQREVMLQLSSRYDFSPSTTDMWIVCCADFDKATHLKLWGTDGYSCVDVQPCLPTLTNETLIMLSSV